MDNNPNKKRPGTSAPLKAIAPVIAMAVPFSAPFSASMANASSRLASVSRNGLNKRAVVSQVEQHHRPEAAGAFSAFGGGANARAVSRTVDQDALAFLASNDLLSVGDEKAGYESGDLDNLTGRKHFLSCTKSGEPVYSTAAGFPIFSSLFFICTATHGGNWIPDQDNQPPFFKFRPEHEKLEDMTILPGNSGSQLFEVVDKNQSSVGFSVASSNEAAVRAEDISVARIGTGTSDDYRITINNVVGGGGATITVTATDGNGNSRSDTFFIDTGVAAPDPLEMTGGDSAVSFSLLEDAGLTSLTASDFAASTGATGTLSWSASGATKGTASATGSVSAPTTGASPTSVTYTPNANATGSDTFTVSVNDGSATDSRDVNVTITPVNDEPTISALADLTFNGVGGSPQTVVGFASMSSAGGGADENTQTVAGYVVSETNDPNSVITSVSIANNGTLTYTPAANVEGVATIQAQVRDSGGNVSANGDDDLSQARTFTITVDTLAPSLSAVTAVTSPTNDSTPDVTINVSQAGTLAVGGSCGSTNEGAIAAGNQTITLTQPDNSTPFIDGTYSDCTITVTDANGNASSALTLSAFQIQLDAIPPTVAQVTAPVADTYMTGETLSFTLTANEVLTVDTASGTPALDLTIGSSNESAVYVSGTGSDTLTFSYTVQNNDEDTDGISIDSLSLNSGAITDVAGNAIVTALNGVAGTSGVLVDGVQPTVAITGASGNINAAFTATITFSEDVTGFDVSDIVATNATLSGFAGTGSTYTVLVTPTADGAVTLDVASATAVDLAGNSNTAATQLSADFDGSVPTVAITGASGFINSAFTATITFSEDVTDFDVSDITAGNATLSAFSGSGDTYTVLVTPTTDGAVTLDVAAAAAVDVAGNDNTAAPQLAATYDETVPTVAITGASGNINAAFTATITFSEDVTGFNVTDITAGNATLSAFSGSGSTYTVLVTPTADGAVTLDVAGAVSTDVAGNNNTAAPQLTATYDGTVPTLVSFTRLTPSTENTAADSVSWTATLSEAVNGVSAASFSLTGSTAMIAALPLTSTTYQVTASGGDLASLNGVVGLNLSASAAISDSAGNVLVIAEPATDETFTLDNTAPTTSVSAPSLTATASADVSYTVTYTDADSVTLTPSDIVLNKTGTADATVAVTGFGAATRTVTLSGITGDGTLGITVPAGTAADAVNNPAEAGGTSATFSVDNTLPTVAVTTPVNSPDAFPITITFSEDVTDFVAAEITATNATVSDFAGSGTTYTATVTPTAPGTDVTLEIAAGVSEDAVGNLNTASALKTVTTNSSGSVSINGLAIEGQTLAAVVVDPDNISNTVTYQWTSTGTTATVVGSGETYVIQTSDIGNTLTVDVSYTDDAGFAETAMSSATAVVISIEQNAWNNIGDSVGSPSTPASFDDYRNVGLSGPTDDELNRIMSILNRAVSQQATMTDIDELSELEALVATIMEGQDDDEDGLPNLLEDDGRTDTDGDGIDDRDDVDADNDGIRDNLEIDALADMTDDDADGIVNLFDFDVDGDGYPELKGLTDDNLDGVIDEFDTLAELIAYFAPATPVTAPVTGSGTGTGTVGAAVVSPVALAPIATAKEAEVDTDGDGLINSQDIDADNDGIADVIEAGLSDNNDDALVDDGTALIDDATDLPDTDADSDARPDFLQLMSNGTDTDLSLSDAFSGTVAGALDQDGDGQLDSSTDVDQDGLMDVVDNAIGAFGSARDFDGDGIPNHLDPDDDNDNISDIEENAELAEFFTGEDADGDGIDDGFDAEINGETFGTDDNGNGVRDDRELPDLDGDGLVDYLDDDADNDGIRDDIDDEIALPVDLAPGATEGDLDGDGVPDDVDPSVNTETDVKVAGKGSMSLAILMLLGGALVLMRRRTRLLVAMPLAILTGHSQAAGDQAMGETKQDSNFSFATSAGLSKFDTELADTVELTDENSAGFVLGLGYSVSDELAVEASYGLLGKAGVNTGWVDYSSLALNLQYRPEVVSYGKLRGQFKLGMNRLFYDGAKGLNLDKKSTDVLTFAVGVDYTVNTNDAVEFMFTSYAEDAHFYSVGYRHNF